MRTPFTKTLAYLDAEEVGRTRLAVLFVGLLLLAWISWLAFSQMTVYAVSDEGRLLAAGAASPVQSPVAGVIAENDIVLGTRVAAGDVLVRLDVQAETLRKEEEEAKGEGLAKLLASLESVVEAEKGLAAATAAAGASRMSSARAKAQVAEQLATLARKHNEAIDRLREASLSSGIEAMTATEAFQREHGQAVTSSADALQASADVARAQMEAAVRLRTVEKDLTELRTKQEASRALIASLEWEIARRTLRAPISGTIADVVAWPKGAAVGANQLIATIVPDAPLRWVAYFTPQEAVGRVSPGQRARIRLDAFPWTAYGTLEATVRNVGSEQRDQRVRVELELELDRTSAMVPLTHGMTGSTDVSVERTSPLRILLRLSGQFAQRRPTPPSPRPETTPLSVAP